MSSLMKKISVGLTVSASVVLLAACGQGLDRPTFEAGPVPVPGYGPEPEPMPRPNVDNNLLSNSGLELGSGDDFTGWEKLNGADNITAIYSDTCFGRGAQVVSEGDNPWDVQIASVPVTTTVDTDYTASMWIKADSEGSTVRFSTSPTPIYQDPETIGTEWQQIVWTFTATEATTTLLLDLGGSTATYNIDDIRLVEGDSPDPSTCPRPDDSGNWLYNGSMEFGEGDDFSGWDKMNGEETITATFGEGCFGRAMQAASAGGNPWDVQLGSTPVPTVSGEEYTASMWIKGSDAEGAEGGIVRMSTDAEAGAQYQGDQTIGTEWQRLVWTFTANDTSTRLVLDLGASEATYSIDDIELVEGDTASEGSCPRAGADGEYIYNGGLELGSGDDFTGWNKMNGADNITATTTEVYSGSRAMQVVSAGDSPWNVQLGSLPIPTVVDADYVASMWIKAENEGSVVRFSTQPSAQYQANQTIGTEWQEVRWEFTANEVSTTLIIDLGGSTETFYIDEISLVAD